MQNFVGGTAKICTTTCDETGEGVQKNVPGITKKCTGVPREKVEGTTEFCTTNTENTTKNTTENSINQSREKEERMIDVRAAY